MNKKSLQTGLLLLCFAFSWTFAQDNPMQQGIAAFNNADYEQALNLFQEAQRRGNDTPALQYNIAVSLFRLGRHDDARAMFNALPQEPRWSPLVLYNLGLIEEAEGDQSGALAYFRQAEAQQEETRISTAASRKIAALESRIRETAGPEATPPVSLLSLTAGSDSNAASLADEFVQSSSRQEDTFAEILGYTQHYLTGRRLDGVKAYGLLFSRQFADFDHLNSVVGGVGIAWEKPLFGYETETELRYTHTRLDGDKVADQARLKLGAAHEVEFGRLETEYYFSQFSAGSRFEQIEGTQNRLDVTWSRRLNPLTLSLRYRFEDNDRDNLSRSNGAYSSYSPRRNQILAQLDWRITDQWSTGVSYEYIDDVYDGINVLRDTDGQVKRQRRERTIDRYSVDMDYRFNRNWLLRTRYERTDVDDVFDLYTYDKYRVSGAVEYRFE